MRRSNSWRGPIIREINDFELIDVTQTYMPAVIPGWWWIWPEVLRQKEAEETGVRGFCVMKDSGLTAWYAFCVANDARLPRE